MTFFAFADRRGTIGISHRVPTNRLLLADDPDESLLRRVVGAAADHVGPDLRVPGIAGAESDAAALAALVKFRRVVAAGLAASVPS